MTTSSPVREHRDRTALEKRRLAAARLFRQGVLQVEIARQFRVSRMAVSKWHKAWDKGGLPALKSKGNPGTDPRLTPRNISVIRRALLSGPRKAGYRTDLWTLSRIAALIKKKTRVAYHPSHVWKILQSMKFSAQMPSVRARERNEQQIKNWKDAIWPIIKKRGAKLAPV